MNYLVKMITDEDGEEQEPLWHFVTSEDSERCFCDGQCFGHGEGAATFETKTVKRGGITCPRCLELIKLIKSIKL